MKLNARVSATAGSMAVLLLSATGCNHLRAADQLNKGVADFKNAKYEAAEGHFQNAIAIDPNYDTAKLYLATTYSSQVVPNLDTPENKKMAQQALDGFQAVLAKNPNDMTALKQIASIDRNIGKPTEAKDYERKVIALDPNDAEANYTIGVVDWLTAYKNSNAALAAEGLTDKGDGNIKLSKAGCAKLAALNTPLITEGLDYLQKAIAINSTYAEAMTYMSLTERRKADLECGNAVAIKADLAAADEWAQKSMGAAKINEKKKEEKTGGGITTN